MLPTDWNSPIRSCPCTIEDIKKPVAKSPLVDTLLMRQRVRVSAANCVPATQTTVLEVA